MYFKSHKCVLDIIEYIFNLVQNVQLEIRLDLKDAPECLPRSIDIRWHDPWNGPFFCSTIKRNLVCICCYWLIIRKFWMHWYRHALFDFAQFFLQSYSNRSHFQSVRNFRRRRANHLSRVVKTDDKWKRQRSIRELGTTATSPKTRKMREK